MIKKSKTANWRIDLSLYKKICSYDPTGRNKFTSGILFIVNEFLKMRGE